jgi:hypothetical protein
LARQAPDPSARIAALKERRKQFVASKVKGPLNAEEMAAAIGMTWRQLKTYVEADPDFPCLLRGSEGSPYQFDAKKVFDHLIRFFESKLKERNDRNRRIAEMAGFEPEMADTGLSLEELRQLDFLQTSNQRKKIEQRQYVPLAEFEGVIADVFTTIQSETLSMVGRLDPAGKWPALVREQVREEGRNLLVRIHDKLGKRLNPDAVTTGRGRRGAQAARR